MPITTKVVIDTLKLLSVLPFKSTVEACDSYVARLLPVVLLQNSMGGVFTQRRGLQGLVQSL